MYTLQTSTELMKNQKAAQVLSDQSQFDALQTSDGNALFFGIGDTNILYLTQEQQNASTGWTPIDLTTELGAALPGKTISAEHFAVSQNASTGDIIIAQVVHTAEDNQDHLFVLSGLSYDPAAAWLSSAANRAWISRPYDNAANPVSPLSLAYIELAAYQDTQALAYLIAGVRMPETSYISNYQVSLDPSVTADVWQPYVTAENYDQLLDMQIGMAQSSLFFGLYELYTLSGNTSLTFTPSASQYGPGPVVVTKLNPPAGASALATLPVDATGHTNLFVAGDGAISLFVPNQQTHSGVPVAIIADPLISAVNVLEAHLAGDQVTLWGRNAEGVVFYSRCAAGQQATPGAWSAPIPIAQGAEQVAALLNIQTQASALFVHTSGANIEKLTQDPVTTQWRSQSLLLPALSPDDVFEYYTFTTHIDVLDENSLPSPATVFGLTATSPVAVYLNDMYIMLPTTAPLQAQPSATGTVTIVQETQTLGAVCYNLVQADGSILNVNPMAGLLGTLGGVQSGSDLNLTVTDEWGNQSPLVPSTVTDSQKDAVAQTVNQFVQVGQSLPPDGSVSSSLALGRSAAALTTVPSTFGLSFAGGDVQYITSGGDVSNAIEGFAGDVLHWMEQVIDDVVQFVVQVADGVAHFFVTIGDAIYHFVLRCASDVLHGIQFVFNKIEVAFDKLVQWLGFIFEWNDILRTHAVIKNVLNCYVDYSIGNLSTYKQNLIDLSTSLQDKINGWADLPQPSQSLGSQMTGAGALPGKSHPAANWGTHQLGSNINSASTSYSVDDPDVSAFEQVFKDVLSAIATESEDIANACKTIKTEIVDQIGSLSLGEIIEKLFAVIADLVVESLTNLVIAIIDLLQSLIQGVQDTLNATIDIPVLSWVYKKFADSDLSIMDLVCLIAAIPATVIYKIAHGAAPFPDDADTAALIAAADFASIRQILAPTQPVAAETAVGVPLSSIGDRWKFAANVLAFATSIGVSICSAIKIYYPNNPIAAFVGGACYIPYCAPDFGIDVPQTWDQIMNEAITGLSIIKTLVDISLYKFVKGGSNGPFLAFWGPASPFVEFGISIAWMVPAVWTLSRSRSPQTIVGVVSNVSFNATGIVGIWGTLDPEQITKAVFTAAVVGTIVVYGAGIFASSFLPSS